MLAMLISRPQISKSSSLFCGSWAAPTWNIFFLLKKHLDLWLFVKEAPRSPLLPYLLVSTFLQIPSDTVCFGHLHIFSAASLETTSSILSILCPGYKGLWVAAKQLAKPKLWHFFSLTGWLIFFIETFFFFFKVPSSLFCYEKITLKKEDLLGRWLFLCLLCCSMTSYSV